LAKYPPEQVAIVDDCIIINYDDQTYPDTYKAEELRALIMSNEKESMTTNISIKVSMLHLADTEASIADATSKLEELKKTTVTATGKTKEEAKELNRDRNKKIEAYTFSLKQLADKKRNIEEAIAGLRNSIRNFENKNKILNEEIALLKL
jgi:chromosome segregation ATPase